MLFKRKQSVYSCTAVSNLIQQWQTKIKNAVIYTVREGTLGYGDMILYDPTETYKHIIVKEVAINTQSSGHTIRRYNQLPVKYQKILLNEGLI